MANPIANGQSNGMHPNGEQPAVRFQVILNLKPFFLIGISVKLYISTGFRNRNSSRRG